MPELPEPHDYEPSLASLIIKGILIIIGAFILASFILVSSAWFTPGR